MDFTIKSALWRHKSGKIQTGFSTGAAAQRLASAFNFPFTGLAQITFTDPHKGQELESDGYTNYGYFIMKQQRKYDFCLLLFVDRGVSLTPVALYQSFTATKTTPMTLSYKNLSFRKALRQSDAHDILEYAAIHPEVFTVTVPL